MKTNTENKRTSIMSGRLQCLSFMLAFLCIGSITASAQKPVRGSVTDESGSPLAGVAVVADLDGKKTGTATDVDGNYSIEVPGGQYWSSASWAFLKRQ